MTDRSTSSTLAMANAIRRSFGDFARRMRALRENHNVSASKLSVLGRLHRAAGPMSATALARLENLQPQSLTRIIAELESEGFIEKKQNVSDRRQFDIQLLAKGTELLIQDARRQNEWLTAAMDHQMTPAERAVLAVAAEVLDRIGGSEIQSATTEPGSSRSSITTHSLFNGGFMKRNGRFEHMSMDGTTFADCSMAKTTFDDVKLSDSEFKNVDLRRVRFEDVNLAGVTITNANIDGLTILGHDVQALIRAEVSRRSV